MFDKIIAYSIENKLVIGVLVAALIVWGAFSLRTIPIDAVPDITNNQVQVITISPSLATQEVEQFITTPVELSLQNIQQLVEMRSISRFGLSVVTVVFEEDMDIYLARQLVSEHIKEAEENIAEGLGTPEMSPISTGLGEIYQYVVRPEEGYEDKYSLTDLRTIQDWIVKRQLSGLDGVVEVNTLGGYLKEYEVAVRPNLLKSMGINITDVFNALENSNENTGGAYIEKNPNSYYIRTNGIAKSLKDIGEIVVEVKNGKPILIRDVADVQFGKAPRYGAMTRDGEEVVGGTVMMLKGENSASVTERIKERVIQIQKSLPEGVVIEPYLVRDKLVSTAMSTVKTNLIEGGLIVVFILVLLLGNWRAGLIVASVIPLAMLFALSMMKLFGISANLMSLGAIDFGLIVDGAVIIVEAVVHRLQSRFGGEILSQAKINKEVKKASINIRSSAAFGEIIILMVYIPILALVGIEGKMFRPMAQTVMLAIGGALILSLSYVPMMCSLFLKKHISNKKTFADKLVASIQRMYTPVLNFALKMRKTVVAGTIALFLFSLYIFSQMGGEFIPTLEEGDLALHQILPPGSSLSQSVEISKIIQKKLLAEFPEVEDVVTKIGSQEIPTDPMPVETGDIMVIMKPKSEWTSADSRKGMFEAMEKSLKAIPGLAYEFSQPIQMRFNELMTGSRADIAIKLYGDDLDVLYNKAREVEKLIRNEKGIGTIKVEQTVGMPQIVVNFKYDKMAQYGLQVKEVNQTIRAAFAGDKAGIIYEGDRRFNLVVRMNETNRNDISDVKNLYITLANGTQVPLNAVAEVELVDAPMQISRENANRKIVIGVNVGDSDIATLVEGIQKTLEENLELPPGYYLNYGGQFENLKAANARLGIAVPIALAMILILLFFTVGSFLQALLIFTAIPLSAIGGIWALQLRDMPFSISAGIGFIALFGVAVLNGIVLIGYFNQLKKEGMTNIRERIIEGTKVRLRPVLMTAMVASFGFLPMAISSSGGAEVQRPLATVVIGGLLTATFLTLVVLPILYAWLARWQEHKNKTGVPIKAFMALIPLVLFGNLLFSQVQSIGLQEAINMAIENHPAVKTAELEVQEALTLGRLKYAPGETEISYQGDGLFEQNPQMVNQLSIRQNFENPSGYKAKNRIQEQLSIKKGLEKKQTVAELTLAVRNIYFEIQHKKALIEETQSLLELYKKYYRISENRYKVGAINAIEMMTLKSSLDITKLQLGQLNTEIQALEHNLSNLIRSDVQMSTRDTFMLISLDTSFVGHPIQVQIAQQEINVVREEKDLLESLKKPAFSLAYGAQNYYEGGFYNGFEASISVPIFTQQIRKRMAAQRIEMEKSITDLETINLELNFNRNQVLGQIQKYFEGASFYKSQVDFVNPEIARISKLNYEAGEISYIELLNTLELLASNQKNYLEQILAHNKSVALYQFLSSK